MVQELLGTALRQAEASDAPVRAAVLLRVARVLTRFDRTEAERLMDRGLAIVAELPDEHRAAMAPQVVSLAACVAPDRAFALRAAIADSFASQKFLHDMVAHGYATAAADYLIRWSERDEFPFDAALAVIGALKDDGKRRDVLRSALGAWRAGDGRQWHSIQSLVQLFRLHWHILPDDVARDEIREIVHVLRQRPDWRMSGSLLFALLGPLKSLDPELARQVIREEAELGRAADAYPPRYDQESHRPSAPPSAEALLQWQRDWTGFAISSGRFFRIEDERKSDFTTSFEYALRTFARDDGHNEAPVECWPSAEDFRSILYAAGRDEGASGARLLDRIPDPTLRLFAQIEFAAGMAGVPQIGGVTREQLRS